MDGPWRLLRRLYLTVWVRRALVNTGLTGAVSSALTGNRRLPPDTPLLRAIVVTDAHRRRRDSISTTPIDCINSYLRRTLYAVRWNAYMTTSQTYRPTGLAINGLTSVDVDPVGW